ncbi:hypothetical protein GRI55_03640 [Erythrobacter citreus]|uniref:DUF3784 domain-containing protein n=1 Tax=Qipengyuania citrea TaxID=225971 RepID=A0A6I4U7D2_9SPHN|nr:hypothetical protein [Qipengyuania citrea]MDQ0566504.1 hypothetical protein [Qipengyuania citrea]MXP34860.1 hypothetical protein [Qipengyuania citrea]
MLLGILFVLGMANFAMHKAMLESNHPVLDSLPAAFRAGGGRISLALEFLILLLAMLLAAHDWPAASWIYAFYSVLNGVTAWLLLNHRI